MPPNNRPVSYLTEYAKQLSNSKPKRTKASIQKELNAARLNLKKASDVLSVKNLGANIVRLEEELNDYNNSNNENSNNENEKMAVIATQALAKRIAMENPRNQRNEAAKRINMTGWEETISSNDSNFQEQIAAQKQAEAFKLLTAQERFQRGFSNDLNAIGTPPMPASPPPPPPQPRKKGGKRSLRKRAHRNRKTRRR